ncbi:hypothetical protein BDN72DRAFT_964783 [Pluteus cervinus]|uniref:Uncharacterized protein n=1 Tax=Pluteus cervinus TaxID=181527 RepID=A0ACD3A8P4_9AGAR|nr:hypothetical protein BDN72DRAFT_964783 [Pluteus cervinus]
MASANLGQFNPYMPNGQVIFQPISNPTTPGSTPGHKSPLEELQERVCTRAAFDSAERGQPPRCHRGTRQAILSGFDTWIGDPTAPISFKLITGWPGTGKSAIAQTIAETCARKDQLAASLFFFRHNSSDDYVIDRFVTTVAWQIMQSVSGARDIILQLIANDPLVFEKSFEWMWQALVVSTLLKVASPSSPMVIIVDGVDECPNRYKRDILLHTLFNSVVQLGPMFKLIITSRPELWISGDFDRFWASNDHIELGNSNQDQLDIETFLRHSFRNIHADCAPAVAQLLPKLVKRACGQFIYASLVVSFVLGSEDNQRLVGVRARLDLVMGDCLKSFKELDSLYLVIMKDVQKSIPPEQQCWLHYLLMCLLVSPTEFEAYKPKEFGQDLQVALYEVLYPVVDITNTQFLQYRHETFITFLTQPSAPHPFTITAHHLSALVINVLSKAGFQPGPLCCWDLHKPTHQLIFFLARMQQVPVERHLRYNNCFLRWLTESGGGKVTKIINLLWQLPLFAVVGLPYYVGYTIKQTASSLYRFRAHDLITSSYQEEALIYTLPPDFPPYADLDSVLVNAEHDDSGLDPIPGTVDATAAAQQQVTFIPLNSPESTFPRLVQDDHLEYQTRSPPSQSTLVEPNTPEDGLLVTESEDGVVHRKIPFSLPPRSLSSRLPLSPLHLAGKAGSSQTNPGTSDEANPEISL